MSDFLADFARCLEEQTEGEVALPEGSKNLLLELARTVAHNSERKNAPLATFVLGRYVQARLRDGVDPREAIAEAIRVAHDLLDEAPSRPSG
jgi:hypothetical protein